MKPAKYITVSDPHPVNPGDPFEKWVFTIHVKWWGACLLIYRAIKDRTDLPWWRWKIFPKCCFNAIRGGGRGHL